MTFVGTGKRILLTGDSHMEWSPFGSKLEELLRASGATVVRMAIGGSAARQWASGKPVCRTMNGEKKCLSAAELRAAGPFDLAIVSMGTNDAANASAANADRTRAAEQAATDIETFMGLVGAPPFIVVGPPTLKDKLAHYTNANMTPLVDVFSRRFAGRFVDSRPVPHPDGDSVHMGRQGGAAWAQYVFDRLGSTAAATGGGGSSFMPLFVVGALAAIAWWRYRRR
jgi:hypothetical protein